jgi:hypothetical protein
MDPANTRQVYLDKESWTVRRDTGVRTGASSEGYYPESGQQGLHFVSSKGDRRYLEMGLMELPSQEEFQQLPIERLKELMDQAKLIVTG